MYIYTYVGKEKLEIELENLKKFTETTTVSFNELKSNFTTQKLELKNCNIDLLDKEKELEEAYKEIGMHLYVYVYILLCVCVCTYTYTNICTCLHLYVILSYMSSLPSSLLLSSLLSS
jgi:hypothetical protein